MTSSFFHPDALLDFSNVVGTFREHVEGLGNGVNVELIFFILWMSQPVAFKLLKGVFTSCS